jgi:hypothetical protein
MESESKGVAVLGWLRRRRMDDSVKCRLLIALARAEEELIETHVRNALNVIGSVGDDVPVDRTLDIYLEAFEPGEPRASIVSRRVMARFEVDSRGRPSSRRRRPE